MVHVLCGPQFFYVAKERSFFRETLDALRICQENPLFDEKERVALEYAEAMTRVDDDLEEQLKNDWGDDEIVELTAFIAS